MKKSRNLSILHCFYLSIFFYFSNADSYQVHLKVAHSACAKSDARVQALKYGNCFVPCLLFYMGVGRFIILGGGGGRGAKFPAGT